MAKSRIQWTEQEDMMAVAYENIAESFSYISKYMKNHVNTVKNGMGVVNDGDLEEILNMLKDMLNKNLHNVSQMRVNITMSPIKPVTPSKSPAPSPKTPSPSPWTTTSTDGKDYQYESKKTVKKITEPELRTIVAESVKKVLSEGLFSRKYNDASSVNEYLKWKHRDMGLFVKTICRPSKDTRGMLELSNQQYSVKIPLPATEQDIERAVNRFGGKSLYRSEYETQRGSGFDSQGRF